MQEQSWDVPPGTLQFFLAGQRSPLDPRCSPSSLGLRDGASIYYRFHPAALAIAFMPPLVPAVPPQLADLPAQYTTLLSRHNNRTTCAYCAQVPRHAALCLICGTVMCWRNPACGTGDAERVGPCTSHARTCGTEGSAFLLLGSCTTVLLHAHGRLAEWKALYLDSNGEEDRGLRRGKMLYLSALRVHELTRLVLHSGFGQDSTILSQCVRKAVGEF